MNAVSIHKFKIAREIKRSDDRTTATFFFGTTFESSEMLCVAWYAAPDLRKISLANEWISIEKASAVSIAIGMAIEWLTEQK